MIERVGAALATATLAACTTLGPQTESPASDETAADLIEFGISLRTLDDAELEQLHAELNSAPPPVSSASTIRLALLLSYGDSAHYDLDRAINLFNQIARTRRDDDPSLRHFAEFMSALLIERLGLAADRNALAEQRGENVRRIERNTEQLERLRGELEQARMSLEEERERRDQLQAQLEALIELEEQLTLDEAESQGAADEQ